MEKCGCKVVRLSMAMGQREASYEISYCPKHSAVDELLEAAKKAQGLIEPWKTYCDYRAEQDLQKADKILNGAIQSVGGSK